MRNKIYETLQQVENESKPSNSTLKENPLQSRQSISGTSDHFQDKLDCLWFINVIFVLGCCKKRELSVGQKSTERHCLCSASYLKKRAEGLFMFALMFGRKLCCFFFSKFSITDWNESVWTISSCLITSRWPTGSLFICISHEEQKP